MLFAKIYILFAFVFTISLTKEEPIPEFVLTYFTFRGRGEFVRLILEYKNASYTMESVSFSDWPKIKS